MSEERQTISNAEQLPAWLSKEFLQDALRIHYKDKQLRVLQLTMTTATAKGQNYVGVVRRLHAEFQTANGLRQLRTYLLKETVSADAPEAVVFREYNVYTREMDMYEFVLPKMSALLQAAGIEEKLHAVAVCVDRKHDIIILEDLSALHYRNANRVEQLNISHVHLTLQMLANYHAAAAVLRQRDPKVLAKNFCCSFFTRGYVGYTVVLSVLFKALLRYVKTQPKLEARYYDKLIHVLKHLMEYGARSFDVGPEDFQTLTHGDCWTNNIMFRYDTDGQPDAVVPIDFQFSTWSSPTVDLHYFFSSSLREELGKRQTELVQYHYYALKSALKQLNYEGKLPSLHKYQLDFEKRRFLALFISLVFQPLMIYEGKEEPNFQNIYLENPQALRFQDSIYESEKAQKIVARMLPIFDNKGLLDDMH